MCVDVNGAVFEASANRHALKTLALVACFDIRHSGFVIPHLRLADTSLHLQIDESLQLHAVFHRELLHEIVDEAVDAEAHRLGFGEAALHEVEDLVGADLADAGFVLGAVLIATDADGGVGVGVAVAVDEQGVALGVVFAAFEVLRDVDEAAIGAATFADGDGFADDVAGGVIGGVDHLRAGVLMLAAVGQGDADDFTTGAFALHDDAGVFHGEAAADVAVDPAHFGVLVGDAALGDEVEDVAAPVLHGDVLDLRAFHGDEFDDGAVQCGGLKLRRGAAFHVHHFRAFIGDDERALELAELLAVDAEVGLERMLHLHAGRHINERAATEDSAVERREFVVASGNDLAEPLLEDLGMFVEAFGAVDEDDALLLDGGFDVRIGGLAVILCLDTGEEFAFLLRDAETVEGLLHVLGHVVPGALWLLAVTEVVAEFVEMDVFQILRGPMRGHGLVLKDFERLVTELADPIGIALHVADVIDGLRRDAEAGVELVALGEGEIADTIDADVGDVIFDGGWEVEGGVGGGDHGDL